MNEFFLAVEVLKKRKRAFISDVNGRKNGSDGVRDTNF